MNVYQEGLSENGCCYPCIFMVISVSLAVRNNANMSYKQLLFKHKQALMVAAQELGKVSEMI